MMSKSKAERAALLAPSVNAAIAAFEQGKVTEGVCAFQAKLLKAILEHGLSEVRQIIPRKCGVHPHNRDKSGLVPLDVHELLDILFEGGWDDGETSKALACEIHSVSATPRGRCPTGEGGAGIESR